LEKFARHEIRSSQFSILQGGILQTRPASSPSSGTGAAGGQGGCWPLAAPAIMVARGSTTARNRRRRSRGGAHRGRGEAGAAGRWPAAMLTAGSGLQVRRRSCGPPTTRSGATRAARFPGALGGVAPLVNRASEAGPATGGGVLDTGGGGSGYRRRRRGAQGARHTGGCRSSGTHIK
jgi:hypothetical protein